MLKRIADIKQKAEQAIAGAASAQALEEVRIRYLGRKAELPNLLRNVAQLPAEERAATGKAANEARRALEDAIERNAGRPHAGDRDRRPVEGRVDGPLPGEPRRGRGQPRPRPP